MGRRIEVELTSARSDGTWTWRAAGAKEPRGVVDAALLHPGAKVGDVVRAEAEFDVDGIVVIAILPPKEKRPDAGRIELIGPPRETPPVTASLVAKRDRPRGERGDRGEGVEAVAQGRRERPGRPGGPGRAERAERPARGERAMRDGARTERPREERPREERPPRPDRPAGDRRARPDRPARAERPAPAAAKPRAKRLNPGNVHRTAVLASLPPEQRAVADQLLRGGIPAMRRAVEEQNAKSRAEGQPEIRAEPLIALAEELLPRLKAAEWRDRADAAVAAVDDIALRDLRSVVAGADAAARDEASRLLAATLRQALERRLAEQREEWIGEITAALDEGRMLRALRVSSRPPDPSLRFPAELAQRLSDAASAAMAPDTAAERWGALLEAVAASPVRRLVKPAGLPGDADAGLLQAAHQAAGRVPALASLLGIAMPPPPGPARPARTPAKRVRPPAAPPGRPPAPERPPPTAEPPGGSDLGQAVAEQPGPEEVVADGASSEQRVSS
jgi:hypothetical protein